MNRYSIERHDHTRFGRFRVRGLLFPVVLIAIPAGLLWREAKREELNEGLISAVKNNDTARVISLLDAGASANVHAAPSSGSHWRLFGRLLGDRAGSRSGTSVLALALGEQDSDARGHAGGGGGNHPIRNPEIVRALVAHGARVNEALPPGGWTPLMLAAMSDQRDIVRLLLDHHADPNLKNRDGKTAMDLAPRISGRAGYDWNRMVTFQLLKRASGGQ